MLSSIVNGAGSRDFGTVPGVVLFFLSLGPPYAPISEDKKRFLGFGYDSLRFRERFLKGIVCHCGGSGEHRFNLWVWLH